MSALWLAPLYAVRLVTALFWSRWRVPALSRPGPVAEKIARVNLAAVATEGILCLVYALVCAVTGKGSPQLGIAAGAAMLCAVDLYKVKLPSPSLWTYAGTGRHADPRAQQRPTSRWPYTIAYTGGYVLLFLFALSFAI